MLWLILLGMATVLTVVLGWVLRRRKPSNAELYSKTVAVEYVHSGVAWLRADGTLGSVNPSLATAFHLAPGDFVGRNWYELFVEKDQERIRNVYGQALLMGMTGFEAEAESANGARLWLNVRLVAVHDGKMGLAGLYCLIEDRTREHNLEDQVRVLEQQLSEARVSISTDERDELDADAIGVNELDPDQLDVDQSDTRIADVRIAEALEPITSQASAPPISTAAIVRRAIRRLGSPQALTN
jgi:PAS domain S-box-containing protein